MTPQTDLVDVLSQRVERVRATIAATARACGRDPDTVRLIAVSKTFGPEFIHAAHRCGLREFGENRVQEARKKIPWCPPALVWHMVGHLQTNKAAWAVRLFSWIHSLDRVSLVETLEQRCRQYNRHLEVLIEIKLSPEPSKTGCTEDQVLPLAAHVIKAQHLRLRGLMTMPPYDPDPERARPYYRRLAEWGRVLQQWCSEQGYPMDRVELSMGMSHDYPVAIEEGATMVRIGTAIFGPRPDA